MEKLYIKVPIWSKMAVGIRTNYLEKSDCLVEIIYKDQFGNRVYPGIYLAKREKAKDYEIQAINNKVSLIIFPIKDLEIMENEEAERAEYMRTLGL